MNNTSNTTGHTGGLKNKVAHAVGSAVNAISGHSTHHGQTPLSNTTQHLGTSSVHTTQHMGTSSVQTTHISNASEVAREIRVAPTVVVEKVERPTIVKETILPQEKIEVQPVIHREREQLEVHEVVQPFKERDIAPTVVRQATLPAEMRAEVRESDTAFQTSYREASTRYVPEVHTEAVRREFVNKPAIVEEHVHKKIVEEIQPVLYKETITPVIIQETQPIYEKVIETPRIVEEMRSVVDLGTRYAEAPVNQMNNLSLGGQPQTNLQMPRSNLPMPHKEVTITQETYVEPARATAHPHTQTKRII